MPCQHHEDAVHVQPASQREDWPPSTAGATYQVLDKSPVPTGPRAAYGSRMASPPVAFRVDFLSRPADTLLSAKPTRGWCLWHRRMARFRGCRRVRNIPTRRCVGSAPTGWMGTSGSAGSVYGIRTPKKQKSGSRTLSRKPCPANTHLTAPVPSVRGASRLTRDIKRRGRTVSRSKTLLRRW